MIYGVVNDREKCEMLQGLEGFLLYAGDDDDLNERINALPIEERIDRAYIDIRRFSHGLTLPDGTVLPATREAEHHVRELEHQKV